MDNTRVMEDGSAVGEDRTDCVVVMSNMHSSVD